jgi:predicted CopG family antitoxin
MSFDLIEKLKEKYADIRGDFSNSAKIEIDDLKRRILENTQMEEIAKSEAGKKLISEVISYIEKIDTMTMDEQVKSDVKLELLKQRKAWITVLRTLMGGKSQLEAIKKQINTYLQIED